MDRKALDDSLDDARRGRIGPSAAVEAAEKRQKLAGHGIDQSELAVVERTAFPGDVEANVASLRRQIRWDSLADEETPAAQALAPQLHEDVPFVRADDRIGRK